MEKKRRFLPLSVLYLCLLPEIFDGVGKGSVHVEASEIENTNQEAPDTEEYDLDARFLKADGKVLRNHAGKGEAVTLRGTNIGGWQVMVPYSGFIS